MDQIGREPQGAEGVSVVIPALNEGKSLGVLVPEIIRAMDLAGRPFEIICVDDGSTDDTFSVVGAFHEADPRVKCVQLAQHLGKTLAYMVGFEVASYPVVATIDADLQNAPADIPRLVDELDAGYSLVCGWRVTRRDALGKRMASVIYNVLTSLLLGPRLHDHNCGLKAYRSDVAKSLILRSQNHRYITSIVHGGGHKVAEVPVAHRERTWGESRYGPGRLYRGLADLVALFLDMRVRGEPHTDGPTTEATDRMLRDLSAKELL